MKYLNKKIRAELEKALGTVKKDVNVHFFSQEMECRFCRENNELLQEMAEVSPRIRLVVHDFVQEAELAKSFGIDKIPATVIMDETDRGIRFFGIPSGYEFTSLVEAVRLVGSGENPLSADTRAFLEGLTVPLHLQVFVTPTCPYCPGAVVMAHRLAYAAPGKVRADMIESMEFPFLAQKYQVMGVPRTVINEVGFLEGAAPEHILLAKLKESLRVDA